MTEQPKPRARGRWSTRFRTVAELFSFLHKAREWLLIPLVVLIVIVALLVILAQTSGIAPFLYPF